MPPKTGTRFKLYLSADAKSIGSTLIQEQEGKERVIFYLSRRLLDPRPGTLKSKDYVYASIFLAPN